MNWKAFDLSAWGLVSVFLAMILYRIGDAFADILRERARKAELENDLFEEEHFSEEDSEASPATVPEEAGK